MDEWKMGSCNSLSSAGQPKIFDEGLCRYFQSEFKTRRGVDVYVKFLLISSSVGSIEHYVFYVI
jgi:hypothetical protein